MKMKITRLVFIGITSFCMLSAMGQEKSVAIERINEKDFLKNEVELRTRATEYWWPDSVISYNYIGEPYVKDYFNYENRTNTYVRLEDGSWIFGEPRSSNGYSLVQPYSTIYTAYGWIILYMGTLWGGMNFTISDNNTEYTDLYDNNGNLVLVECTPIGSSNVTHYYRIKYNKKINLFYLNVIEMIFYVI